MNLIKSFAIVFFISLMFLSCEKKDSNIIDQTLSFPSILSVSLNPITFDTSAINALAKAEVISEVRVKVTVTFKYPANYMSGAEIGSYELKDDGIFPDSIANDGSYAAVISFILSCRALGAYSAEFLAENNSGLFSPKIIQKFNVINSRDSKPIVAELIAPDSLRRPSGIGSDTGYYVFFQAYITDPDGPCDVKKAFFNSYNSLNHPNSGNPWLMYDDGNIPSHRDTTANDNHFSFYAEIFPLEGDSAIGTFRYDFFGKDKSDSLSNTLTHYINIYR